MKQITIFFEGESPRLNNLKGKQSFFHMNPVAKS